MLMKFGGQNRVAQYPSRRLALGLPLGKFHTRSEQKHALMQPMKLADWLELGRRLAAERFASLLDCHVYATRAVIHLCFRILYMSANRPFPYTGPALRRVSSRVLPVVDETSAGGLVLDGPKRAGHGRSNCPPQSRLSPGMVST